MTSSNRHSRILGLDVARALAIGGMALVHFAIVLSANQFAGSAGWLIDRLAGRPATAFMILAGMGVSLQALRSRDETQRRLWRRGWFFLAVGYVNLLVWNGDILRVYGIAYLVAVFLLRTRMRTLWAAVSAIVLTFVVLVMLIDFETNWDFETLHYANLWTLQGGLLNLFYNGFRAVYPWLGVFFLGMILGRCDLRSKRTQKRLMVVGLLVWGSAELISYSIRQQLSPGDGLDAEMITALFGTDSLPAMPLFLISSSGLVISAIAACIYLAELKPITKWLAPLASAGQMAFTWYILHIVVVLVAGFATEFRGDVAMSVTVWVSCLFFAAMIFSSCVYRGIFRFGPLEWLLRRVAK